MRKRILAIGIIFIILVQPVGALYAAEANAEQEEEQATDELAEKSEWELEAEAELSILAKKETLMALVYLCDSYGLKEKADTESGTVLSVSSGTTVQILGADMDAEGNRWFQVSLLSGGTAKIGFIEKKYLAYSNEALLEWENTYYPKRTFYSLKKAAAVSYEDVEMFPDSYQDALYSLKSAHPNWIFVKQDTGLNWKTVISKEDAGDLNLSNSKNSAYQDGYYGAGWYYASTAAIEYYMDPRNFLDETRIFQFEQLTFNPSYHTQDAVQNILNNTFMAGNMDGSMSYAEAFYQIGTDLLVSPFHLACRVYQEQGQGTSPLISGTYSGYIGYYNYFNIGASGQTEEEIVKSGLEKAKAYGWNTRYLSLKGGSSVLSVNYILKGQDTLYLQKFNVDGRYYSLYTHQYMQNVAAPYSESYMVKKAYSAADALDSPFVFKIPVYQNMPDENCPKPEDVVTSVSEPTTTPTATATPTATVKPTITPTATATPTATVEPTAVPTATPTVTPTVTAKPTAEATLKPTAAPTATAKPAETAAPTATVTPTATPLQLPGGEPIPTTSPTVAPVAASTAAPKPTTVTTPTATATAIATLTATTKPTAEPTQKPSAAPTEFPAATATPTEKPASTAVPTEKPAATSASTEKSAATAEPTENPGTSQKVASTQEPVTVTGEEETVSQQLVEQAGNEKPMVTAVTPAPQTAQKKEVILMDMGDSGMIYAQTLQQLKEQGREVVLQMNQDISWRIDGENITDGELADVDLRAVMGESRIPKEKLRILTENENYVELSLSHSGELGFTAILTVTLETAQPEQYANLFYYNEETGEFEFMCASVINAKKEAEFAFTHASDYVIIVSDRSREDLLAERQEEFGQLQRKELERAQQEVEMQPAEEPQKAAGMILLILLGSAAAVIGVCLSVKYLTAGKGDKRRIKKK